MQARKSAPRNSLHDDAMLIAHGIVANPECDDLVDPEVVQAVARESVDVARAVAAEAARRTK